MHTLFTRMSAHVHISANFVVWPSDLTPVALMRIHIYEYMHTCAYTNISIHMHICTRIRACTYTNTCIHMHIQIYPYIFIYAYVYIPEYMHAYCQHLIDMKERASKVNRINNVYWMKRALHVAKRALHISAKEPCIPAKETNMWLIWKKEQASVNEINKIRSIMCTDWFIKNESWKKRFINILACMYTYTYFIINHGKNAADSTMGTDWFINDKSWKKRSIQI